MTKGNCVYSLLAALLVLGDAVAAIRVGNLSRSYSETSKNRLAAEQQYYNSIEPDVYVPQDLPVPVANAQLAEQIKSGDENAKIDRETLNRCAMIYPEGDFVWDKPTIGRGAGGAATCVAVVEMRAIGANGNQEHTTVARGKLAAGDSIRCNISDFPAHSYLPDIESVVFPADNSPTREDVIRVLNEEQKNKAGLKIAAAALIGGLGGNFVGKSAPGDDRALGLNSEKLKTTAAGALGGAALMTASTFSGKVAGDMILHSGVNAAAGGVIGNMAATGSSVLRVEKCKTDDGAEHDCLWGVIQKTKALTASDFTYYATWNGKEVMECKSGGECKINGNIIVGKVASKKVADLKSENDLSDKQDVTAYRFCDNTKTMLKVGEVGSENCNTDKNYYEVNTGDAKQRSGSPVAALVVDFHDSAFGAKEEDWTKWKKTNATTAVLCQRDTKGAPYNCNQKDNDGNPIYTLDDFNPFKVDVDDGGVVDFSNKARLGSTLKGAGVGGAVGAFSGYQGAQSDIEERFSQAKREYDASLEKIYCGTGKKFLSFYNDDAIIPTMKE